jgi:organic hydroperoxide reductase OsmC/OhrA
MKITASVKSAYQKHDVQVETEGNGKSISITPKREGFGSSVNGGELLFLALATCFCNDLYREASKRKVTIDSVDVTVSGEFGWEGEPARNIAYEVDVKSQDLSGGEIADLISYVDKVAEIHNTLRRGITVQLKK